MHVKTKLCHTIDDTKSASVWIWANRAGTVFLSATILAMCWFLLYLRTDDSLYYLLLVLAIPGFGFLDLGILDSTWRNERYTVMEQGILLQNALYQRKIPWDRIVRWEIRPVNMVNHGYERDYIVLYMTEHRPPSLNLTICSVHRKEMLVIRYTAQRLQEIENLLPVNKMEGQRF